jgi:S-adenosylmethionine:tRNA ribosyltransferase-isomerase
MRTSDFDYSLPEELIAQYPPKERGTSRLLVYDRASRKISHHNFSEITSFFDKKDLLVFNDTKVIPGRLYGKKKTGGKVEILLVREVESNIWEAMVRSSRKVLPGLVFYFDGGLEAEVVEKKEEMTLLRLSHPEAVRAAIERYGEMPLPPYINRAADKADESRYQTVFARRQGAVAAPTAGLHFTDEIINKLCEKGVATAYVTLHVGPGTFRPVKVERLEEHRMHSEWFEIDGITADRVNETRDRGGRVVAVGTTAVRTLESAFSDGKVLPKNGFTDIFICPGYRFRLVDCVLTNFHLPKSTLFMLISALVGTDELKRIYAEAIREKYRFFSYGDAMLIV